MLDHPLARLGWRANLTAHLDALDDPELVPARVMAVDRGRVIVDAGTGPWSAPLAGRVRRTAASPATGDFVAVLPTARCAPSCRGAASSRGAASRPPRGPRGQRRPRPVRPR